MVHRPLFILCLAVCLIGCGSSGPELRKQSGGYRQSGGWLDRILDGNAAWSFHPHSLKGGPTTMPTVRRIAVAELGEPSPSPVLQKPLAGKPIMQLASRPYEPMDNAFQSIATRLLVTAVVRGTVEAAATQATLPPQVRLKFDGRDLTNAFAAHAAAVEAEFQQQSDAEIERLCEQAVRGEADVLLLVTTSRHVAQADSSLLGVLNLLILPIWVVPTESITGEVSACGWLIEPSTRRVIRSAIWQWTYKRYTPSGFRESRRESLFDHQRNAASAELAKTLLE